MATNERIFKAVKAMREGKVSSMEFLVDRELTDFMVENKVDAKIGGTTTDKIVEETTNIFVKTWKELRVALDKVSVYLEVEAFVKFYTEFVASFKREFLKGLGA